MFKSLGMLKPLAPKFNNDYPNDVKQLVPLGLLVLALVAVLFSLLGEDNYSRLSSLKRSLVEQNEENEHLRSAVGELRHEVRELREDDRALEKAARNEMGLARPDEKIFIFEKKPPKDSTKKRQ